MEARIPRIHPPGLHHLAGVVLSGASWITLVVMITLSAFDIDTGSSATADWLFGVPAVFRASAWVLFGIRGTWAAWIGVLAELMLVSAIGLDMGGDMKGNLLMFALVLSNFIPGWWALRGGRWSAVFGLMGTALGLVCWVAVDNRAGEAVLMPLLISTVLASWLAVASIGVWGLRHWREQNLEEERTLE